MNHIIILAFVIWVAQLDNHLYFNIQRSEKYICHLTILLIAHSHPLWWLQQPNKEGVVIWGKDIHISFFYFLSFLLTSHYANDCTSAKPGKGCNLRQRYTRPVEARCTSWQVQPSALITGICKTDNRFTSRVNSGQMSGKNMKSGAAKNGDVFHKRELESKFLQYYRTTQVERKSKPNWSSWRVGSTIQAVAAVLGANM